MENTFNEHLLKRNVSIDIFRGLVMILMVFVNDFWSVGNVPHFLEHFDTFEDGMGLSDVVFPMFLFAMGMSIPYAIERRFSKGYSGESTLGHILTRTFALLIMGVFIVNSESGVESTLGYGVNTYRILMVISFFLIWNTYSEDYKPKRWFQLAGVLILLTLAITFRTPDGDLFRAGWWGILGLIGWAYGFCATAYMLLRKKPVFLVITWGLLILLNMLLTGLRDGGELINGPTFINDMADALNLGNCSSAIMAMGGVLLSLAERHLSAKNGKVRVSYALSASCLLSIGAAVSHNWWIISKNSGTLPWCLYVSALSVAFYTFLRILESDGKISWFQPIRYSGLATLTVYMIPYVLYSINGYIGIECPQWLTGAVGLIKCALFSFLCLALTTVLARCGCKLKI